jgi:hypothetical protein
MGFESIYDDRSDREDIFDALLIGGVSDIGIDNHSIGVLFDTYAGEVQLYLRTGWNEIIDSLNNEITNSGSNKDFLESMDSEGVTILSVITATLT